MDEGRGLHFVFGLRMCQLSPLTRRTSIRFCGHKAAEEEKEGGAAATSQSASLIDRGTFSSTYCLPDPRGRPLSKSRSPRRRRNSSLRTLTRAICYWPHLLRHSQPEPRFRRILNGRPASTLTDRDCDRKLPGGEKRSRTKSADIRCGVRRAACPRIVG